MRNTGIFAIVIAVATSIGFQTATAGLLGAPINLLSAIKQINQDVAPTDSCVGYTDDVFIGLVPIKVC